MIRERGEGIPAAEYMDLAIEHNCDMSAAWIRKRAGFIPLMGWQIIDLNFTCGSIRYRQEAADNI